MGTVTTTLRQQARSIFRDLGYTVSGDGTEFLAKRKWRVVQVTPMPEPRDPPTSGDLRCFVTRSDNVQAVQRRLRQADVEYEWAIIGVREGGDYDVACQFT